jgi:hypothetical protein
VVAVVRPERHLALRVVQRMQRPPPAQLMRDPVPPVVGKVEDQRIEEKSDPRMPEQRRHKPF